MSVGEKVVDDSGQDILSTQMIAIKLHLAPDVSLLKSFTHSLTPSRRSLLRASTTTPLRPLHISSILSFLRLARSFFITWNGPALILTFPDSASSLT